MKHTCLRCWSLVVLLLLLSTGRVMAQFDPVNPDEPYMQYKVSVTSDPAGMAYCYGTGSYLNGTTVNVSTSSYNASYQFDYWTMNGEKMEGTGASFTYQVGQKDVKFVAHYTFNPGNPAEPVTSMTRNLTLQCTPEGSATFNYSSTVRLNVDGSAYLCAYGASSYSFLGWYEGDELVSSEACFFYTMPDRNVVLTAKYEFDPSSPDDPSTFYSTSCIIDVVSANESKGTVSISGLVNGRAVYGTYITVTVDLLEGAEFQGWSDGESIVSTEQAYTFLVTRGMTLTAIFDRQYQQGDVNGDGQVNIVDVSNLLSILCGQATDTLGTADVNGDGVTDTLDVSALCSIILDK